MAIRVRTFAAAILAGISCWLAVAAPVGAQPSPESLAIVPGSFAVAPSGRDAGAHSDLSISLELAHDDEGHTFDDLRTASLQLPAGLVGDTQAVSACPQDDFLAGAVTPQCSPATQIGTLGFRGELGGSLVNASLPLYNLVPTETVPAQLGARLAGFTQLISLRVRSSDGGLSVSIPDVSANVEPSQISIEIWGVPAAPIHDPERGRWCSGINGEPSCNGGEEAAGAAAQPFMTNPTRCGPAPAEVRINSWEEPQAWSTASAEAGPIGDCDAIGFAPTMQVSATSPAAESATGFAASLEMSGDWSDPAGRVPSALRDLEVALPAGFSLNPSFAAGIEACGLLCSEASRVGTVELETPMLDQPLRGSLSLAHPFVAGSDAGLALRATLEAPAAGLRIELPVRLELDAQGDRSTAVIEGAPQLPIRRLAISFGSNGTGPLVTPTVCGKFGVGAELAPWSAPGQPRRLEGRVSVDRGAGGAACPQPGALPFQPRLTGVSAKARAGANSSFRLRIDRDDGEAWLKSVSFRLPPGLSASLAEVDACPDAAIARARARAAAEELAHPSCPRASRLGQTLIGAGVGTAPAELPGGAYLAGPFAGAPLSVALVTPALLGPFDLGTDVVRETVRLDPRSGALLVGSADSVLPARLEGIPLRLRSLAIDLDRPELLRNPTGCRALETRALVEGAGADRPISLSQPYRVEGCRRLRFAPRLQLRFLGTSARNGHPGLRVAFISHPDEANLASASFSMPPGLLLDPRRIGALCGARQLAARDCPPRSGVGRSRAISPLLGEPLRGHLYLLRTRRSGLPDLVADLRNRQASLQIAARLRMAPSGLEVVTEDAPDLPFSKLVLVLAGGSRGMLVHSTGFCGRPQHVRVRMVGHNGKTKTLWPGLPAHCPPRDDRRKLLQAP